MGWTCHYTPPRDEKAEIERLMTYENEDRAMRPILTTRKGSVWYVAVEVTCKTEETETYGYTRDSLGRYVFAAVVLTRRGGGEWCYKDMEESMGPCEAMAPKKLLDLLSETDREYAVSWRERCRKNAALVRRKVNHGDVVRFEQPLTFGDGIERQTFKVIKERFAGYRRATTCFECVDTGTTCRISRFMQRNWSKV